MAAIRWRCPVCGMLNWWTERGLAAANAMAERGNWLELYRQRSIGGRAPGMGFVMEPIKNRVPEAREIAGYLRTKILLLAALLTKVEEV